MDQNNQKLTTQFELKKFGLEKTLTYLHGFFLPEIGRIADQSINAIPASNARQIIENKVGQNYRPMIHLDLSGKIHNVVELLKEEPNNHLTLIADAVIIKKDWPVAIDTFLGDCTCNIMVGPEHLGFIHAGRPELFDGIIEHFFEKWPDALAETAVFMGPGICGKHYEVPNLEPIKGTELTQFACRSKWNGPGYDVKAALKFQLAKYLEKQNIQDVNICPFCEIEKGNTEWASATFYKLQNEIDPNFPKYTPRDCPIYSSLPANWLL